MSTTGQFVRRMLQAFVQHDSEAFREAAEEYIKDERRKNHHLFARDLERILANGVHAADQNHLKPQKLVMVSSATLGYPRDVERDAPLVELLNGQRCFDSLALSDSVCETLQKVIQQYRQQDLIRSHGLAPSSKLLFCGPPGCGKTVAAQAVATSLYLPLFLVRFDAVVSSYLGETAANLRKVFDFSSTQPMVILFDEFDAIGKHRMADDEHGEIKRVINSFLQMLDGYRGDALIIAATNHQGLLDPALWRRFDEIVYFDLPTPAQIQRVLELNLRQYGCEGDVDAKKTATRLKGMPHADVERIAIESLKAAILLGENRVSRAVFDAQIRRQRERIAITRMETGSRTRQSINRSRGDKSKKGQQ